MSLCIVTCGPASTKIDEVRRITNFSTGELGTILCETLRAAGHEVICLRGEGATHRLPLDVRLEMFFGNDDLLEKLLFIANREPVDAVFHAAALTDFEVAAITNYLGKPIFDQKLSSANREINIRLRPAIKVIGQLRGIFPNARIVGWKYELKGSTGDAIRKGRLQVEKCQTNGCVVNGAAFGPGFALVTEDDLQEFSDKTSLAKHLSGLV